MPDYIVYEGPSLIDEVPIIAIVTIGKSGNRKLTVDPRKKIAQLWILVKDYSPVAALKSGNDHAICGNCPARNKWCYVTVHQAPQSVWKAYKRGRYKKVSLEEIEAKTNNMFVRLGSYGDPAAVPRDVLLSIVKNASTHTGYTHQWREGFAINDICMASVENEADEKLANSYGFRAFRTVIVDERMKNHMICPSDKKNISCDVCSSCVGNDGRKSNVQIKIHGAVFKVKRALPIYGQGAVA